MAVADPDYVQGVASWTCFGGISALLIKAIPAWFSRKLRLCSSDNQTALDKPSAGGNSGPLSLNLRVKGQSICKCTRHAC